VAWAWILLLLLGGAGSASARVERWLCPDCPGEVVERAADSATHACPKCKVSYSMAELSPPLCYASVSTRDTELAWNLNPDNCRIYKMDGLETFAENGDTLWVPWIMIDWFIPRMRLVKLTDGRELHSDYAKDKVYCPEAPKFAYEVTDSLSMPGRPFQVFKDAGEYSLAELFIVAFSPAARDSARVRFVKEIEAGKHPRLPRTQPHVIHLPDVKAPAMLATPQLKAETIIDAHVHERRGIIGLHVVKGSGKPELDQAALTFAQSCSFSPAGELGVPVPCWVRLHVKFEGMGGIVEVEPAPNGFWRR
jgi:TonB family protein